MKKTLIMTLVIMVVMATPLTMAVTNMVTVALGSTARFITLAGAGITFSGSSNSTTINGDIGTYPTTTITGLGNVFLNGVNHAGDAITQTGKVDLVTAYNDAVGRPADVTYPAATDLGGLTLTPGVHRDSSSFAITGTLTLDAQGNQDAVLIFQAGSTLITASASVVSLTNGAQARNVFWQVGSSATLGTTSIFRGTILAMTNITMTTGAMIEGRTLARNGAVIGIIPFLQSFHCIRQTCSGIRSCGGGSCLPGRFAGRLVMLILIGWAVMPLLASELHPLAIAMGESSGDTYSEPADRNFVIRSHPIRLFIRIRNTSEDAVLIRVAPEKAYSCKAAGLVP